MIGSFDEPEAVLQSRYEPHMHGSPADTVGDDTVRCLLDLHAHRDQFLRPFHLKGRGYE